VTWVLIGTATAHQLVAAWACWRCWSQFPTATPSIAKFVMCFAVGQAWPLIFAEELLWWLREKMG